MGKLIDKILDLIETRGLTQGEVEARAGLRKDRISAWKQRGEPKASQVLPIAKALGVDVRYLLDDAIEEVIPDVTDAEAQILSISRIIGHQTAIRRLTVAPDVKIEGPSYGEMKDAERRRGGKDGGRRA